MNLREDLGYIFRALRKSPLYASITILTIALAIGSNSAIFSFVDNVLLKQLPYSDLDRIVRVSERRPDGRSNFTSSLNYIDWANQSTSFEFMAAQGAWSTILTGRDEPIQLFGYQVSASYFDILGAEVALGRTFLPGEDEIGNDTVVVLTHRMWSNNFGSDPSIVGQNILLGGVNHTVVGVLVEGIFDREYGQIYKPLAFQTATLNRDFHWLSPFAKLKRGVTIAQAQSEMDVIGERIAREYPSTNEGWGVLVSAISRDLNPTLGTEIGILFSATGFIWLIACANLAHLALARGLSRRGDDAIRASLGASPWILLRQSLYENVVLSIVGGVLGLGLAYASVRGIVALVPPYTLPSYADVQVDIRVVFFTFIASILTGMVFGAAPAIRAAHTESASAMKDANLTASPNRVGTRSRDGLIVAQVAVALVMLIGSGLLIRSFHQLMDVDLGFNPTNIVTAGLPIVQEDHTDPTEFTQYLTELRSAIAAVPGVLDTALATVLPLQGRGLGMPFRVAEGEDVDLSSCPCGFVKIVSPSYFDTLGITILRGRALSERDRAGAARVVVINEHLAQQAFPEQDPIGQHILLKEIKIHGLEFGLPMTWEIVGVIAHEKIDNLRDDSAVGMYLSNLQNPIYYQNLAVRTNSNPDDFQDDIRRAVNSVNRDQPLNDMSTLERIIEESAAKQRLDMILFSAFGGIALLLSTLGIYGVLSYVMTQRAHEFGIRSTMGASSGSLVAMVFKKGMILTVIGLLIGLALSLLIMETLASLLFGVKTNDPLTMSAAAILLIGITCLACIAPARRAANSNPVANLRAE